MNPAQIHLAINHLPVVLSVASFVLLIWGNIAKSRDILRAGLVFTVATGLLAVFVFISGDPAADFIQHFGDVSKSLIHDHDEAADFALILSISSGVTALSTFFLNSKPKLQSGFRMLTLFFAAGSMLALLWTAHLGGMIRHPEIRSASQSSESEQK